MATRRKTKARSSLVENINRRKREGKSRPKSRSTISPEAYEQMRRGWPKSAKKTARKRTARKKAARKKTPRGRSARKD